MPVESMVTFGALKWLVGLVLAPWLWHERRRVDALQKDLEDYKRNQFTKEEVKEQIILRNKPILDRLDMIYTELKQNRRNNN